MLWLLLHLVDFEKAFKNRNRRYATNPIAEPEVIGSPVKNHNAGIIITGFSNNLLSLFFKGETNSRTYATRRAQVRAVFGIDLLSELRFAPKAEDVMK
ncbi:hypothetical protein ACE6H2_027472 [Prunus campanulata]